MNFEIIFVLLGLIGMLVALILDKMRPGIVLLSLVVIFMAAGIITPKQMVAGFSNRGMITVALLFLVSEGIRQSGALSTIVKKLLPEKETTVAKAQLRLLPLVSAISAFLNNTPVVVIFAPIVKNWAKKIGLSCTKFLIPLSYATILGGLCTLIGTSTNLVVHGMMIEKGLPGLKMFDLAFIGIPITIVGLTFIILTSKKLLPAERPDNFECRYRERKAYCGSCACIPFPRSEAQTEGLRFQEEIWSRSEGNTSRRTGHHQEFGRSKIAAGRHAGFDCR